MVRHAFLSSAVKLAAASLCIVFVAVDPAAHAGNAPVPAMSHFDSDKATVVVGTCADDGSAASLRGAIAAAADGDTVDMGQLDCGTIALDQGAIIVAVDDLTLVGPGRDSLTIDGMDADRVFLHQGEGTLRIHGLTLARGNTDAGFGGCVASDGSVELVASTVTACSAHDVDGTTGHAGGGGIFALGDIVLDRSTVSGNTASSDLVGDLAGGGLLTWKNAGGTPGNVILTDSLVSANRVESSGVGVGTVRGGGIHSLGTVTALRSVISDNVAVSALIDDDEESITRGGGISAFKLDVRDSTIVGNSVLNSGGAMDSAGGGVNVGMGRIHGSTLANNRAEMTGGGLVQVGGITGASSIEIVNSTISGNSSGFIAGGVMIIDSVVLRNSTVAFNSVDDASPFGGGGVVLGSNDTIGAYQVESTIIGNNTQAAEAMLGADLTGFFVEAPLNIVGAGNLVMQATFVNLPPDTIDDDPQLLPLADNGGRTLTHALPEGSPAIDAGVNTTGLASDQRGSGYLRSFGGAPDIGAFELQPALDVIFRDGFESP